MDGKIEIGRFESLRNSVILFKDSIAKGYQRLVKASNNEAQLNQAIKQHAAAGKEEDEEPVRLKHLLSCIMIQLIWDIGKK